MNKTIQLTALSAALALAGCGGGGGFYGDGSSTGSTTGTGGTTTPVATNYHIVLSSSKPNMVVTGDTTTVTARLLDANGGGVAGQNIVLSIPATLTNGVTIDGPAMVTTDANGVATFAISLPAGTSNATALISSGIVVNATFTDTTNKVTSQTTTIGVVQSQPASAVQYQLLMSSSKSVLAVTGDTATVTVKTLDANGGGVAGQPVVLSLPTSAVSAGVSINGSSTVTSDANGNAVFTINLAAATGANATSLIANGIVLNASLTVGTNAPIKQILTLQVQAAATTAASQYHLVMNTSKSTIVAGNDTATVTAKVLDANGGGVAGQPVVLSIPNAATNGVTINGSSTGTTDASGSVTFTVQSQTNNNTVNLAALIASGIMLNATTTNPTTNTTTTQSTLLNAVQTLNPAPTIPLYHLAMAVSKPSMVITGDTATVTVKALDVNGGSVAGQNVTLNIPATTTNGVYINGSSTVATDANGNAVFTVVLPTSSSNPQSLLTTGIAFTATVTDANNLSSTQSTMVNVISAPVQVAAQYHLVMSASKSSILVDGDTVAVTTKLVDANGGGVAGQNVLLTIPNTATNGITIAGSSTGVTDVNGNVTFNLTSNKAGLTPAQVAALLSAGSFVVNSTFTDANNVVTQQSTSIGVSANAAVSPLYSLAMATSKPSLVVTGDSATVVVRATNVSGGAAVAGQNVTLSIPNAAALGVTLTSPATTQTDVNGNAIFTFALAAGTTTNTPQLLNAGVLLQATITDTKGVTTTQSTIENVVTAPSVTNPIYNFTQLVSSTPTIVMPTGNNSSTLTVTTQLVDANGGGVAGQNVVLSLPQALITNGVTINGPSTAVTDVNGYVTYTIKLANVSNAAALLSTGIVPTITYNNTTNANPNPVSQTTLINVVQATASAYHLSMTSSSTSMLVTGGTAIVTVKVLDNNAGGVAGKAVTLSIPQSATNGMTISGSSTVVSDASGNAVFTVTMPDDSGNAAAIIASGVDINASVTDANNVTAQQTTHINVIQPPVPTSATYRIDLSSNVPTVLVSGGQIVVTTKLVDANGGGVANQQVVLSIPGTATNGVTIQGPSTATTDANGNITYTLIVPAQSNTSGIQVNASYTASNGVPITQSTNINVATSLAATPLYHLAIATSTSSLKLSGDTATITVKALDANNGGVAGRNVTLNIPVSSGLTVNGSSTATTDVNGNAVFTVNLAAGSSNPAGIDVTSSITDANNNTSQQVTHFNVVSPVSSTYQVVLSSSKSNLLVTGDTATMTVKLLDLNGGGVAGQNVQLSLPQSAITDGMSITGPSTIVTDANGNAVFTLNLPAATGASATDLLTNGVVVTASFAAVAGQPATSTQITKLNVVQASANSKYHLAMASNKAAMLVTGDSATVTVTALDTNGGGVQGQNVVLSLPTAMQQAGVIISGPSTVTSDMYGNAVFTVTIPSANPTNNPQVDTTSLLANGITVNASLTDTTGAITQQVTHINGANAVNPQPVGQITVGQSSTIAASADNVYYNMPMSVNVVGVDGKPVANQSVTMSIAQLEYYKGKSSYSTTDNAWEPIHSVKCTPTGLPYLPISFTGSTTAATATTATYVTDSTGKFDFTLRYAKNYAGWLDVAMTATATVSGTTITSLPSFSPLPALANDVSNVSVSPPNLYSPYNPLPNDPNYATKLTTCP